MVSQEIHPRDGVTVPNLSRSGGTVLQALVLVMSVSLPSCADNAPAQSSAVGAFDGRWVLVGARKQEFEEKLRKTYVQAGGDETVIPFLIKEYEEFLGDITIVNSKFVLTGIGGRTYTCTISQEATSGKQPLCYSESGQGGGGIRIVDRDLVISFPTLPPAHLTRQP